MSKARLKINGQLVHPQAAIDNLVLATGSTVAVQVPTLDSQGKIESQFLPSYVDDIIDLVAIASTAPSSCAAGDRYYNSASGNLKIYTATAANTWGTTGATPEKDKIYVNIADSKIYRWSGSAMVEISKQISTVTSIRAASSALDTVVPTEKAVASALGGKAASSHTHSISNITNLQSILDGKQDTLTAGTNISISNGTISCTYSYSLPTASASVLGGVKIGSNISISSGVISVADATATTKGVVVLDSAIANSNSASPGGAAQCYAVKVYVADQLDAISGTYVLVSNLVSALSGVTGTGSGGGENPATAWAVKDYVDTELAKKQGTLTAGTGISITSGTVSCTYSYSLPTATSSVLGGVKVGTNISVSSGTISVANGSTSAKGVVQLATVAEATAGTLETKAVTPKGLKTELDKKQGTLTAGTGISISNGTISNTYSYSLPTASASVLGGVKIGSNISISSGVISVADATATTKGVVVLDTDIANSNSASPGGAAQCYAVKLYVADQLDAISGTYVLSSNLVSALSGVTGTGSGGGDNPATAWAVKDYVDTELDKKQGTLTAGTNISISNGTVSCTYSYSPTDASTSAKGVVKISTTASNGVALAISSGTLSVSASAASTTAVGTVRLATTAEATAGTSETLAVTPKGLKTELDKKANSSHTHSYQAPLTAGNGIALSGATVAADISTTASNGVALAWDGSTENAKKIKVTASAASTSAKGTVQLASTTEATTGTDTAKAVTCAGLKAALDARITVEFVD